MRIKHLLYLLIVFLCNCKSNEETIAIWIENNSDMKNRIEVTTYLNDSIIDKREIIKDSIADKVLPFRIKLPSLRTQAVFKFVIPGNEETRCLVKPDSINNKTLLHVNYVEKVFKKGSQFNKAILQKDSIIRKEFYCDIMYKD